MKKLIILLCLTTAFVFSTDTFSQVIVDSAEITASVPELNNFHEIIYPIWHTAYPEKDITALKGFVPQIKTSMSALNNATLPGILKDKEADWEKQLAELNASAVSYYSAAEKNDDEALLTAAEKLHHDFEMMVRVIRPVMKEMDEYHQTLYIIFHKLYPAGNYDEIARLTDSLVERAEAIMKYPQDKLKRRLGDRISDFELAAKELYKATVAMKETLKGSDAKKKEEAVEHMHAQYQILEAVFD